MSLRMKLYASFVAAAAIVPPSSAAPKKAAPDDRVLTAIYDSRFQALYYEAKLVTPAGDAKDSYDGYERLPEVRYLPAAPPDGYALRPRLKELDSTLGHLNGFDRVQWRFESMLSWYRQAPQGTLCYARDHNGDRLTVIAAIGPHHARDISKETIETTYAYNLLGKFNCVRSREKAPLP